MQNAKAEHMIPMYFLQEFSVARAECCVGVDVRCMLCDVCTCYMLVKALTRHHAQQRLFQNSQSSLAETKLLVFLVDC